MLVTPDFSEIAEEISAGTYRVVVRKGEVKEWPSGGQYVRWETETVGEADPKNNGRRYSFNTNLSGKGAFMLQRLYSAATSQKLTGSFDTEQLAGKQITLELADGVNRQTGQPSGYVEVKSIRPAT